ncbi:hypothetical protein J4711_13625 [Staphylococcus epidermidis]|nr:hypothetical protein [Staphylococcus epidermidis]
MDEERRNRDVNFDLQNALSDTGIDVTEGVDFAINQPLHAIVSCTANVGFRNLGGSRAELLTFGADGTVGIALREFRQHPGSGSS